MLFQVPDLSVPVLARWQSFETKFGTSKLDTNQQEDVHLANLVGTDVRSVSTDSTLRLCFITAIPNMVLIQLNLHPTGT